MHAPALHQLQAHLQQLIDQGLLPGAVALIQQRGDTVLFEALGAQRPSGPPMARDTLFRIYSMTKPIVSLAVLRLMEQGRLQLADPVSRYVASFAQQQVWTPHGLLPVQRDATLHDLLRHTAGLSYAWEPGPVAEAYLGARIGSRRQSNEQLVAALGPLPLQHQPGSTWEYSRATDVLGAVLEVVTGQTLGEALNTLVLGPLGMDDTGFCVPAGQQHRLAEPFERDPQTGAPVQLIDVSQPPVFESGGGGLVSSASDYARFLQLMLGGGSRHDLVTGQTLRLLSPATLRFMTADHLGPRPVAGDILAPGHGFGLGVAVRRETGLAARPGSAGQYSWSGLGGTVFFVDPAEDLLAVLLTQAPGQLRHLIELWPALVYAAL
ncbi:serine hydrolase [Curvibacter sp. RS43]|uniref:serine hydrolase domain-containing protein n=1 Tax=Curvibacter microcysteis TaxID=3026419 RepID=UPI002362A069|nr:serine hydrolase domain-containing protein [Curvibacter sp. RS43]MDD0811160.1 serine hydrolase [Curvibacter sp. RS43]